MRKLFAAFPNLTSLIIHKTTVVSNKLMERFLDANPHLKELDITHCHYITNEIIRSIAERCSRIEKFVLNNYRFGDFARYAEHFKRLKALKSLEAHCGGKSFSLVMEELAAAHTPLECLRLFEFHSDRKLAIGISQCTRLKQLELSNQSNMALSDVLLIVSNLTELAELHLRTSSLFITNLMEIVRCAPKLQTLRYFYWYYNRAPSFDEAELFTVQKIRTAVVKRKQKCRLDLKLRGMRLNVPKKKLEKNADILRISYYQILRIYRRLNIFPKPIGKQI